MEKEPSFIGPKPYTEKEEKGAREAMNRWREAGRLPIEGELEQTEEERYMIGVIQELLIKELRGLGFDGDANFDSRQFHFFDEKTWRKRFPDSYKAFMKSNEQSVWINRERSDTPAKKFAVLLHEAIHLVSFQRFYFETEKSERGIYDARLGYQLSSPWKKVSRDLFRGLNEAMTELHTYALLKKNAEKLADSFGITSEDTNGAIYGYMDDARIVDIIVKKIAGETGKPEEDVRRSFLQGLYRGNLLHLKVVDQVFGKGSLRVLGLLSSCETEEKNEKVASLIERYFAAESAEERAAVKREVDKIIPQS